MRRSCCTTFRFVTPSSQQRGLLDLNDLIPSNSGWFSPQARQINDSGQIRLARRGRGSSVTSCSRPFRNPHQRRRSQSACAAAGLARHPPNAPFLSSILARLRRGLHANRIGLHALVGGCTRASPRRLVILGWARSSFCVCSPGPAAQRGAPGRGPFGKLTPDRGGGMLLLRSNVARVRRPRPLNGLALCRSRSVTAFRPFASHHAPDVLLVGTATSAVVGGLVAAVSLCLLQPTPLTRSRPARCFSFVC